MSEEGTNRPIPRIASITRKLNPRKFGRQVICMALNRQIPLGGIFVRALCNNLQRGHVTNTMLLHRNHNL